MWELRKTRLYGYNPSIEQSPFEIVPGELQGVAGGGGGGGGGGGVVVRQTLVLVCIPQM